jgi:hypothetical protein
MATLHVAIAAVNDRALTGVTLPVAPSVERTAKTLATTATSAADAELVAQENEVWIVTARDADHWVKFGSGTPVAGPNAGYLIMAGTTREFGADANQKIAARTV